MFVQFENADCLKIRAQLCGPQDPEIWPFVIDIPEDDARFLAWISTTASFLPVLPTLAEQIATERYNREGVGITVDGSVFDTTRDGQALIAGAAVSAILDPTYTCNWKTGSGFVELTASQLIGIATAVRAHVQACFDRELTLLRALESGEYKTDMLIEGWPDSPTLPDETPSSAA